MLLTTCSDSYWILTLFTYLVIDFSAEKNLVGLSQDIRRVWACPNRRMYTVHK